mmetsp:Transcript_33362/g.107700  ORF Transcript_33362/g.107700 Transcript_33362/m.107700 type:complete len:292 (-) Transcript_33362:179-1054(-)
MPWFRGAAPAPPLRRGRLAARAGERRPQGRLRGADPDPVRRPAGRPLRPRHDRHRRDGLRQDGGVRPPPPDARGAPAAPCQGGGADRPRRRADARAGRADRAAGPQAGQGGRRAVRGSLRRRLQVRAVQGAEGWCRGCGWDAGPAARDVQGQGRAHARAGDLCGGGRGGPSLLDGVRAAAAQPARAGAARPADAALLRNLPPRPRGARARRPPRARPADHRRGGRRLGRRLADRRGAPFGGCQVGLALDSARPPHRPRLGPRLHVDQGGVRGARPPAERAVPRARRRDPRR